MIAPEQIKQICSEQCGAKCCRGPLQATLSLEEAERLGRFAAARGIVSPVKESFLGNGFYLDLPAGEACTFLDKATNLCSIHDERPGACKMYPLQEKLTGCLLSGWVDPVKIFIGVPRSGERTNRPFEGCLLNMHNYLRATGMWGGAFEAIGATVDDNQNDIAAKFLESNADYCVFIEDDMVFKSNTAAALVWKMEQATRQGLDIGILCGLYFQRTDNPYPHFYRRSGIRTVNDERTLEHTSMEGEVAELLKGLPLTDDNEPYALSPEFPSIMEIDAGSTGLVAIRRDVFETVRYPWFRRMGAEIGEPGGTPPDFAFFYRAAQAGFKAYGDVGTCAGHLTQVPIGTKAFQEYYSRRLEIKEMADAEAITVS